MRTPLFAANWKMFKTVQEAFAYTREFRVLVEKIEGVDIVVATPCPARPTVCEAARNSNVAVAAQTLYWENEGAYTGEVSGRMIREAGADYAIVGHSERRRYFGETDRTVNRRTVAAFAHELTPIVCIGETLEEREGEQTLVVLDRQLRDGLDGLTAEQVGTLVVAYEPVWAIGTGRNATPQQAGEAHAHIRGRLKQWFGAGAAEACRILYGGSVKPDNVADLRRQPDVDGALVGGASLDPRTFFDIVKRGKLS